MAKQKKTGWGHYTHYLFVFVLLAAVFLVDNLTAMVAAGGGQTSDAGATVISNPNFGAIKGTVQFVIRDGETVVSTDKGANYRLYFSRQGQPITNYSLVKPLADASYSGTLSSMDADSGSVCATADYTTELMYYDENNDGTMQPAEKEVFSIVTDSNGCFAAKIKSGAWDIYA